MNNPIKLRGFIAVPPWSSKRLAEMYSRFATAGFIGEIWETSVATDSSASVIGTGELFCDYVKSWKLPEPPLVKLISAATPLSVQVHPDDAAAKKHGGTSKSEIWYVLDAAPGSSILYGTKDSVTPEDVLSGIKAKTVPDVLNTVPVSPGDVIMIPPGMIHSLGGGITVLEVQDKIGTTYRLQDLSGDRETHPAESMDSLKIYTADEAAALAFTVPFTGDIPGNAIASTDGFTVTLFEGDAASIPCGGVYLFCVSGAGTGGSVSFSAGDSLFFTDACRIKLSEGTRVIIVK